MTDENDELSADELEAAKQAAVIAKKKKKTSAALVTEEAQSAKELAALKKRVADYEIEKDEDRTTLCQLKQDFEKLTNSLNPKVPQPDKEFGFFEKIWDDISKW